MSNINTQLPEPFAVVVAAAVVTRNAKPTSGTSGKFSAEYVSRDLSTSLSLRFPMPPPFVPLLDPLPLDGTTLQHASRFSNKKTLRSVGRFAFSFQNRSVVSRTSLPHLTTASI